MSLELSKKHYQNGNTTFSAADGYPREIQIPILGDDCDDIEPIDLTAEISETSLPIMATANDVREVVRFLKRKPVGVTIIEAMNAEPRRIFDARKIAAYEFWGIIERTGERLKLSDLGYELAKKIEPEREIHRRILRSVPPYLSAVESISRQKLKIVTRNEVVNYWKKSHPQLNLSEDDEKNIEAVAVSFFSICHAAELGTTTIGKRGQPARLRINTEQLEDFLETPDEPKTASQTPSATEKIYRPVSKSATDVRRIYLSVSRGDAALENLQSALELADFEDFDFNDAAPEHGFLSLSQMTSIQQCQAAVFLLNANDCVSKQRGEFELCGVRLAEISVAQALFNRRVVVLWNDSSTPPPAGLRQMDLRFFNCENFDWESGVSLVKLLKSLRN